MKNRVGRLCALVTPSFFTACLLSKSCCVIMSIRIKTFITAKCTFCKSASEAVLTAITIFTFSFLLPQLWAIYLPCSIIVNIQKHLLTFAQFWFIFQVLFLRLLEHTKLWINAYLFVWYLFLDCELLTLIKDKFEYQFYTKFVLTK